jgi:glycerophosphoryl diester phosphodiesterase
MQPVQPPAFSRSRIVAHRGASVDAPENSLAAFRRAWELGVEAVELDVRVTADQQVVVIHDATTRRTTSADLVVADHTLVVLAPLGIPTLGEALATIPPGCAMFVEIKSPISTVPAVAQAIRAGTPSNAAVMLQGYDAETLAALSAALPGIDAYWTVDPPYSCALLDDARARGFAGLALSIDGIDEAFLTAARKTPLLLDVWTANTPSALAAWTGRDEIRWVETDRPDLAPRR